MFGFGVYFNIVTDGGTGGGGAPATEIFTANVANLSGAEGLALDPALATVSSDWSASMRFNADDFSNVPQVFAPRVYLSGVDRPAGVLALNTNGIPRLALKNDGLTLFAQDGTTVLSLTQDYHAYIAHDVSAKTFDLYIDGVFEVGVTYTGLIPTNTSITVGGRMLDDVNFGTGLDGRVWDIEMFNKLLSVDELAEVVNVDKAKCFSSYDQTIKDACVTSIPAYNHTGFTGEERTDQSASGNNASDVGGTVVFTGTAQIECLDDGLEIFTANVADFNVALDPSMTATPRTPFDITDVVSMSVWVNVQADASGNGTVSAIMGGLNFKVDNQSYGLLYFHGANTIGVSAKDTSNTGFNVQAPVLQNQLYHVVGVIDTVTDNEIRLYVDRVLVGTVAFPTAINLADPALNFCIGGIKDEPSDNYGLNGLILAPSVFTGVVTQEEMDSQVDALGNPRCFDLWADSLKAKCIYSPPLENHTGTVGQELVNKGTATIATSNTEGILFNGAVDIECAP